MASSFTHLRDFLQKHMRMSRIYQPVMIKELLQRGGQADVRDSCSISRTRREPA
jgi:hypothetical protein